MSLTEKLLENINEYTGLLKFLDESHPDILKEWKSKALGPGKGPAPTDAVDDIQRTNLNVQRELRSGCR